MRCLNLCLVTLVALFSILFAFYLRISEGNSINIIFRHVIFPILVNYQRLKHSSNSSLLFSKGDSDIKSNSCIHPLLNIPLSCEHLAFEFVFHTLAKYQVTTKLEEIRIG